MSLRRCKECTRLFSPERSGRFKYLCEGCCNEIDAALDLILPYLKKIKFATITQISENTGVPTNYVWVLLKEGALDGDFSNSGHCKRCDEELNEDEEEMCTDCKERVSRLVKLSGIKGKVSAEIEEEWTQKVRHARITGSSRTSQGRGNNYGMAKD